MRDFKLIELSLLVCKHAIRFFYGSNSLSASSNAGTIGFIGKKFDDLIYTIGCSNITKFEFIDQVIVRSAQMV